jgi:tetratricopeptide (TPR) repeat protein
MRSMGPDFIANCQLQIANCKLNKGVRSIHYPLPTAHYPPPTLLILILLLLPGCTRRANWETVHQFEAAQKTFDEATKPEDFVKAAAQYQELADAGVRSGAVYYNLGNAWIRAGQAGRAIAAYRQAQRYLPRNPYLLDNLRYALGRSADAQNTPVWETIFFWQNWLSYPEKFSAAALAIGLTFLCGVIQLWFPRRRIWKRLALAGLFMSGLLIASAAYDWYRFDYLIHGVVVQSEVTARKGNGENYAPAFNEKLTEGTEFRLLQRRGDWLSIRLRGGQEGWIPEKAAMSY